MLSWLGPVVLAIGLATIGCDATPPTIAAATESPGESLSPADDGASPSNSSEAVFQPESAPPWTEEELVVLLSRDSDGDGESDGEEVVAGSDPFDPLDDRDVDGDGVPNAEDDDVDGDGVRNADDADIDGDGRDNVDDDDDDGDGESDVSDDDADGDGEPDCDCGDNGECSPFLKYCICKYGYEGKKCDRFHCHDVRECNNGTCVGPNACRCDAGWESVGSIPCAVFQCRNLRNCNEHGECVGADKCDCDADWDVIADCSIHLCDRQPSKCNDGDPCTRDVCDPKKGCSHEPACASTEICLVGDCFPKCDNTLGCDSGQSCRDGGCQEGCFDATDCRDGDPCTTDTCNSSSDCEHELVDCSASNQICVRGRCVTACLDNDTCGSGNVCRDDGCFTECDDDQGCQDNEVCDDDACRPNECQTNADCGDEEECDDGVCVSN